jgi:murein DD-endopeptidase MepM/ murein hydrolase activator NlpD
VYPSKDKIVDFHYGVKYHAYSGIHKGVDFFVPTGTPVKATVPGIVVHVGKHMQGGINNRGWGPAYGIQVIVKNDNFKDGSPGYWAGYMHLSKVEVKLGEKIKKGQLLGLSGATGRVKGPHLHFEIQKARFWSPINHTNPQKWLDN